MHATLSSYRDEYNNVVDDIDIEHSPIERVVVLRDEDGSLTVRARRYDDDVFEYEFETTDRMFQGLEQTNGERVHPDVATALFGVGFTVEPAQLEIETPNTDGEDNEGEQPQL